MNDQPASDRLTCDSCSAVAKELHEIQPALTREQWAIAHHNMWSTHAPETEKLAWVLFTLETSGLHHRVDLDAFIHAIREHLVLQSGVTVLESGREPTAPDVVVSTERATQWAVRWIGLLRDDLGELSARLQARLAE